MCLTSISMFVFAACCGSWIKKQKKRWINACRLSNYKDSVLQMSGAFPVNRNLLGVFPGTWIHTILPKEHNWCQNMNERDNKADNSNSVSYIRCYIEAKRSTPTSLKCLISHGSLGGKKGIKTTTYVWHFHIILIMENTFTKGCL